MITIDYMFSNYKQSADDNLHTDVRAAYERCMDAIQALRELQRIMSHTDVGMLTDHREQYEGRTLYTYSYNAMNILKRMLYMTLVTYAGDYEVEEHKEDEEDEK